MSKRWVLGAFAALAMTFVAACGGSDNKGGILSGNNGTPGANAGGATPAASGTKAPATSSTASAPPTSGASGVVNSALSNLAKAKSFKGKISVEGGQFKGDGSLEVVTPDKFHLSFNGGGLGTIEIISVGTTTYTKTGTSWTKSTGGSGTIGIDPTSLTKQVADVSKTAQVTKSGADKVDGKSCDVYKLDDAQSKSTTELCIANDLPLRLVASGSGSKVTLTFSDFNSNIDIKAPI